MSQCIIIEFPFSPNRKLNAFDEQLKKALELSMIECSSATSKNETADVKREEATKVDAEKTDSTSELVQSKSEHSSSLGETNSALISKANTLDNDKKTNESNKADEKQETAGDVIDLDESERENDDFIGKTKSKSALTREQSSDQEKRKSVASKEKTLEAARHQHDDDFDSKSKKNKQNSTGKKKKKTVFSDSEEDEHSVAESSDDDDDDYKKKSEKKPSTKQKSSLEDKAKESKKSDKENAQKAADASKPPPLRESKAIGSDVKAISSIITTPNVSKIASKTSMTASATSTPDLTRSSAPNVKPTETTYPVNKLLTNNNLANHKSACSSPLGRIEIKTPSPFARVGLSRNSKVKPLHPNAKLNN